MLVAAAAAPLPLFVRSFVGLSVRSRCAVSRWSTPSQLATNSINHHRTHRPPPTRPHTRKPSRDTQHTRTHARTHARTHGRTDTRSRVRSFVRVFSSHCTLCVIWSMYCLVCVLGVCCLVCVVFGRSFVHAFSLIFVVFGLRAVCCVLVCVCCELVCCLVVCCLVYLVRVVASSVWSFAGCSGFTDGLVLCVLVLLS